MDHTIPPFEFGGHEIRVVVSEVSQTTEFDLENFISRGATGTAKLLVARRAIKTLHVDGQSKVLVHRDPDGSEEFRVPNIRDRETRKGLLDRLMHIVVEKNDFLGFVEPFSQVFGSYLPEEDQGGENPTVEAGSSTGTPSPAGAGPTPAPTP